MKTKREIILDNFKMPKGYKFSNGEDKEVWLSASDVENIRKEIVENQRLVALQLANYTDDEDLNKHNKRDLIIIGDAKLDTYKLVLNLFDLYLCNSSEQNDNVEKGNSLDTSSSVSCEQNTGEDKVLGCLNNSISESSPVQNLDRDELAKILHYPDCWDTACYDTLESALYEVLSCNPKIFVCTNDDCKQKKKQIKKCTCKKPLVLTNKGKDKCLNWCVRCGGVL